MKFQKLFEPARIGSLELANRIVMIPMNLNYTEGSEPRFTARYINHIAERAKGGAGLIITGHVKAERTIDPYPAGSNYPCLDKDYYMRDLTEMAEVVHAYSSRLAVMLSAGSGRLADMILPGKWPKAPSPVPLLMLRPHMAQALTLSEIAGLVEAYGEAADRVRKAGCDAIEVHCFGGHLIDQFLTSLWNKRTDRYGGSLENRMRFMLECIEAARGKVGRDFPLICRLSSDHKIKDGRSIEETIQIARKLEEVGIDALHLSAGCYESSDWICPPMYYPQGCAVPFAQPIKAAVKIPVIVDGRIIEPDYAEGVLKSGQADFVGMGRALLADPEWPNKARSGHPEDIRRCIGCNCCISRVRERKYGKCTVNPEVGAEGQRPLAAVPRPKKVIVVGGGPAGMEAARVAALRGHQVTLFEQADNLGGHLLEASVPSFKKNIGFLVDWLVREIGKAGVAVKTGRKVGAVTIQSLKPDAVIIATGSSPIVPDIPGIKGKGVVTAIDVLLGKAQVGDDVVVIGGGMIGCETALYLAGMGKRVTILEMLPYVAGDLAPINRMALLPMLQGNKVKWMVNARAKLIEDNSVITAGANGQEQVFTADSIVLAVGLKAEDNLYRKLDGKVPELYKIGDAREPRDILGAVHEGAFVAREL